ncbi:aminotransferase class IV [Oleidesulfovibrio alaskensis]|uniref:aminotransferase class IV n=1 Tax=Oleidesulfovibrio alaskensis TaxID=58180 RepID=UPI001A53D1AE|nr:aminotransferase class IV [Oleidesulfovibrio alaskensis]MBL3581892.1 aminotransferase class IV [Oleidesulfovibrio alaskensis]
MTYVRNNALHCGPLPQHVTVPSFRSGTGFYETLLYNGCRLVNADAHMERITRSARACGLHLLPVDLHAAAQMLLDHLGLCGSMARINLFYTLESAPAADASGLCPPLVPAVTAAPYTPPPADKAFRLCRALHGVQSWWHEHKTTAHMGHLMERTHAQAAGYDDAVLHLPDGAILETTTAALIFYNGSRFTAPFPRFRLSSTAEALVKDVLGITYEKITADRLGCMQHAYVLNALMGMRPVRSIDTAEFNPDTDLCNEMTVLIQKAA